MKKFLLTSLFCVVFLLGFCGMVKAVVWEDITGTIPSDTGTLIVQSTDGIFRISNVLGGIYEHESNSWHRVTNACQSGCSFNEVVKANDGYFYGVESYYGTKKVWRYVNNSWTDITIVTEFNSSYSFGLINGNDNLFLYAVDVDPNSGGWADLPRLRVWKYANNSWELNFNVDLYYSSVLEEILQASDGRFYFCSRTASFGNRIFVNRSISANTDEDISPYDYSFYEDGSCKSFIQDSSGSFYLGISTVLDYARAWKYNGSVWEDTLFVISGEGEIDSLGSVNGVIYAGGYEKGAGGYQTAKVWTYSGNVWSENVSLLTSADAKIDTLYVANDGIYASGNNKVWKYAFPDQQVQQNNLENGDKVILKSGLKNESIFGQDLTINFKKLPTKLTKNSKYWMKWNKNEGYRSNLALSVKKSALKKYWKLTTNLNKYKAKKKKQQFKIKVTFNYTKAEFKVLKKKNKLAKEKNLVLKYKVKGGTWKSLTDVWTDAKIKHNIKKHKFMVSYFTKFPKRVYYFGIMLK